MKPSKSILLSFIFCFVTLYLAPFQLFAKGGLPQNFVDMYEIHTMDTMGYRLLRPINFDPTVKYPVVITLHNGPATSNIGSKTYNILNLRYMNQQFASDSMRSLYPAYILCPQSCTQWGKNHLLLCQKIIETTLQSVDMNRIYVMGQSMGGQGTYVFVGADPSYFAAAIACSSLGERLKVVPAVKDFNLWTMHGNADTTIPYSSDSLLFQSMKLINARMKFTTFIQVGHSTETLMMNNYIVTNTPLPNDSLKHGYTTQVAGPGYDPEPNTIKWLFSKIKNPTLAALSSINNNETKTSINQTKSTLSWSCDEKIDEVLVYNTLGSIQFKISNPSNNSIDISILQHGMYLVKFNSKNQNIGTKKIMIN
jgi:Secretion system C-terminal sorting domain/Phospholipase/Carboxylesterase